MIPCQQVDEPFQHLPLTRLIIIKHALINRYFQSKFNGTRFVAICVEMGLLFNKYYAMSSKLRCFKQIAKSSFNNYFLHERMQILNIYLLLLFLSIPTRIDEDIHFFEFIELFYLFYFKTPKTTAGQEFPKTL